MPSCKTATIILKIGIAKSLRVKLVQQLYEGIKTKSNFHCTGGIMLKRVTTGGPISAACA